MAGQINHIKANIFSTPMPDMPPALHEMWQVAFMYRRKYSAPDPSANDAEQYFAQAWADAQFIAQSYGNCETVKNLLAEVYLDIERQWKVVQARQERSRTEA